MQPFDLRKFDIVLLGAGHTNAHVLRMWRMNPIAEARLTCISDFPVATYSGMLPGVLAGQYPPERMTIDLVRLCAAADVRLLCGKVEKVDCRQRVIHMAGRPPIPFDVLSIGVGSRPRGMAQVGSSPAFLPIKPMQTFLQRLHERLEALRASDAFGSPLQVVIVGGGVAGVEIAFCLPAAIHRLGKPRPIEISIVEADRQLVPGVAALTRRIVSRELQRRGVRVLLNSRVVGIDDATVRLADGSQVDAHLVIWATGAEPSPLLEKIDSRRDEHGFLLVRNTLQTLDHDHVFAVGDCATLVDAVTAKAGVYAVRQGPILWENLRRLIEGQTLLPYRPQRNFLKLINLGDGRAIGEYHGLAFSGRWCWRLKDFIDSRFMDKYQDYRPAMPPHHAVGQPMRDHSHSVPMMRCLGCGGKIGSTVLSRALSRLEIPRHPQVLLGLDRPDDAAIVRPNNGNPISVTVDFFTPPLKDAYVAGRLAALNAASDCYAVGSRPFAALASVTLPYGPPNKQEQLLYELLLGGLEEFRRMGATMIGGHTIEGPQLTIGFTMLANQAPAEALTKSRLQVGDRLLLTKPLGTGTLLAAHMRALCRYDWYQSLVEWMLASNQPEGQWAMETGITGLTDVTGFGLAGHLGEMLRASNVSAKLQLRHIPLLDGVRELVAIGVQSTLAPDNRHWESIIQVDATLKHTPEYQALFDPQTSGGLLIAVPMDKTEAWNDYWQQKYGRAPWWIGCVVPASNDSPMIFIEP